MKSPPSPDTFAFRFRSALDDASVSVTDLVARRSGQVRGVSQNSMYRYLRGGGPPPGFVLWAAAELGVTHDWLRSGIPPRYPGPKGQGGRRRTESEAAFAISVAINTALREAGLEPERLAGQAVRGIVLQLVDACSPDELPDHATVASATKELLELIVSSRSFFERVGGGNPPDHELYIVTAAAALSHLVPREPSGVALSDVFGPTKAKVSKGRRADQVRSGGTVHIAESAVKHPRDAERQAEPGSSEEASTEKLRP